MEWAALNGISLWIPMGHVPEADVRDIYEMAGRHPSVPLVLAGSHYVNYSSVLPLLRARDNIYVDLSRFDIADGVVRLVNLIGAQRLLFGSSLPDVDPIPYIYYLGQCGLRQPDLEDICHCNLERLLGHENY
jgi:predicted TIM-barrel fold metal-dependent hydrolase